MLPSYYANKRATAPKACVTASRSGVPSHGGGPKQLHNAALSTRLLGPALPVILQEIDSSRCTCFPKLPISRIEVSDYSGLCSLRGLCGDLLLSSLRCECTHYTPVPWHLRSKSHHCSLCRHQMAACPGKIHAVPIACEHVNFGSDMLHTNCTSSVLRCRHLDLPRSLCISICLAS